MSDPAESIPAEEAAAVEASDDNWDAIAEAVTEGKRSIDLPQEQEDPQEETPQELENQEDVEAYSFDNFKNTDEYKNLPNEAKAGIGRYQVSQQETSYLKSQLANLEKELQEKNKNSEKEVPKIDIDGMELGELEDIASDDAGKIKGTFAAMNSQNEQLNRRIQELEGSLKGMNDEKANRQVKNDVDKVQSRHPNYLEDAKSDEFNGWLETLPPRMRTEECLADPDTVNFIFDQYYSRNNQQSQTKTKATLINKERKAELEENIPPPAKAQAFQSGEVDDWDAICDQVDKRRGTKF